MFQEYEELDMGFFAVDLFKELDMTVQIGLKYFGKDSDEDSSEDIEIEAKPYERKFYPEFSDLLFRRRNCAEFLIEYAKNNKFFFFRDIPKLHPVVVIHKVLQVLREIGELSMTGVTKNSKYYLEKYEGFDSASRRVMNLLRRNQGQYVYARIISKIHKQGYNEKAVQDRVATLRAIGIVARQGDWLILNKEWVIYYTDSSLAFLRGFMPITLLGASEMSYNSLNNALHSSIGRSPSNPA